MLAALRGLLPDLDVPELYDRLTAVQLALQIRDLTIWPAPGPDPAVDHPVRVIGRLLELAG